MNLSAAKPLGEEIGQQHVNIRTAIKCLIAAAADE
jgi:hypothetical protein